MTMEAMLLFMGLGMQELLLIGLVILIFFGARKIPEFMKGLGKGVREFKDGIKERGEHADGEHADRDATPPPAPRDTSKIEDRAD